jgi:hypothetical protein
MWFKLLLLVFIFLKLGCTNPQVEYSENTFIRANTNDSFVIRSYSHLEFDSIWRYSLNEGLVGIYTGDSLRRCTGSVRMEYITGELYAVGECLNGFYTGKWKFYRKSGDLHFIDFFSKGFNFQRWFPVNDDTFKLVRPIIDIEPRVANVDELVDISATYNFDNIDTANWDYYLYFDFISKEKFINDESLPFENYMKKYEGKAIEQSIGFFESGEIAMYGYTLAINRETGDSITHLEIEDQFLKILDSTSVEL